MIYNSYEIWYEIFLTGFPLAIYSRHPKPIIYNVKSLIPGNATADAQRYVPLQFMDAERHQCVVKQIMCKWFPYQVGGESV